MGLHLDLGATCSSNPNVYKPPTSPERRDCNHAFVETEKALVPKKMGRIPYDTIRRFFDCII